MKNAAPHARAALGQPRQIRRGPAVSALPSIATDLLQGQFGCPWRAAHGTPRCAVLVRISTAPRELVSCVTVTPVDYGSPKISVTGRMAVLVGGDVLPHSRGDMGGSGGALLMMSPRHFPQEFAYTFRAA